MLKNVALNTPVINQKLAESDVPFSVDGGGVGHLRVNMSAFPSSVTLEIRDLDVQLAPSVTKAMGVAWKKLTTPNYPDRKEYWDPARPLPMAGVPPRICPNCRYDLTRAARVPTDTDQEDDYAGCLGSRHPRKRIMYEIPGPRSPPTSQCVSPLVPDVQATHGFPQGQPAFYPPQQGYPPQQSFPAQQGYPPRQSFPPQQGYFPQQGFPPQQGYPPQQAYHPHQEYHPQQGYSNQPFIVQLPESSDSEETESATRPDYQTNFVHRQRSEPLPANPPGYRGSRRMDVQPAMPEYQAEPPSQKFMRRRQGENPQRPLKQHLPRRPSPRHSTGHVARTRLSVRQAGPESPVIDYHQLPAAGFNQPPQLPPLSLKTRPQSKERKR